MINNTNEILSQINEEVEVILKNTIKEFIAKEKNNDLNLDNAEQIIGKTIKSFAATVIKMAGDLLSSITEQDDMKCICCEKYLRVNKKSAPLSVMTLYGKLTIIRNTVHCRSCGIGRGINDILLNINREHRITNGFAEIITYTGQLIASFEEASETIEKFLGFMGVEANVSQIREITEENGKKVFEKEQLESKKIYNEPEKYIPDLLDKDKKEGSTYTLMDGSQINTRKKDKNGSSWKEMKLVEGFCDKNIIKRKDGNSIIVKKEYGAFFGSVNGFKKEVLKVAIRNGYGEYKNHVVLGDGAAWIWNMSKELFPGAIEILDFYHVIENTYDYAKVLYPNDEIKRVRWVNKVLDMIENGKEEESIKFIDDSKVDKLPKGIVNLPEYLKNNKTRIQYKKFKDLGYYIGSGAIESGNKTVIQHRMKQAGMRWNVSEGQYISSLRAKYKSNLWNDVVEVIGA